MEYKYHRAIGISALTLLMIMMMFSADYIYMNAWALSLRQVNNTENTTGIVRTGSQIWVSSNDSNNIRIWTTSGVLLGSIGADVIYLFATNSRVYGWASSGTILYEFDPVNIAGGIIRTSATLTGCVNTASPTYSNTTFYCSTGASNTINMVNLLTFVVTTSSTTNTGANACNAPAALAYSSVGDALIAGCNTSDNVVVIENVSASGTPDYGTGFADNWGNIIFDSNHNQVWGAENTGADLNVFDIDTVANTISLNETVTHVSGNVNDKGLSFEASADRVFVYGASANLDIFDAETHDRIITVLVGGCVGTVFTCTVFGYSTIFAYVSTGSADYFEVDLTGVTTGGGGSGGGGVVGASICYIDTNADGVANIIYRDTTGPEGVPDGMCDGSVLDFPENDPADCTANNIARLLAGLLGIDCDDDPNPATNGIGMLYMLFLGLFVMGVIFAGSRKFNFDMASIHPAVWLFFAVGITGFSWQVGWVDSIVFYAMIIVCAGVGAFGLYQKLRSNGG